MNLVTPDTGLLFWMVVIFGIVFFLLARFGFPIITDSLRNRSARIQKSLDDARELEVKMQQWSADHARMLEETKREQGAILREATDTKNKIIADARAEARSIADKMIADAKIQIAAEKESALTDVRKEVAMLGIQVAEKILRKELSDDTKRADFLDSMVEEVSRKTDSLS